MRSSVVVGVVSLVLLGGAAAPAAAAPEGPDRFGDPVYLALGDSVPAGVGLRPGEADHTTLLAGLLEQGYNPAADKATPGAAVGFEAVDLSVPGATTATLLRDRLPAALQLIAERDANRDPFDDVEVVTVTIAGNDLFGPAVQACIATSNPAGCQATIEQALAGIEQRLGAILGALTAAAGRDTEVVVTTYYNPIGSCFLDVLNPAADVIADVALEGGALPGVLVLEAGLDDVIRDVAAGAGAQVAELSGALDASQYVGGSDCLHPNASGQAEIADVLYATLAG
jgi:lysophospholipase L1-like esterase